MTDEVVEKPVAWMRRWAFLGHKRPSDEAGKYLEVSKVRCLPDDIPLYSKEKIA